MNTYRSFEIVAQIFAYAGVVVAVAAFVLRARADSWTARPVLICTAGLFFILPAAALFRLLSSPLHEQGGFTTLISVGLILVWLLAAPIQVLRSHAATQTKKTPNI